MRNVAVVPGALLEDTNDFTTKTQQIVNLFTDQILSLSLTLWASLRQNQDTFLYSLTIYPNYYSQEKSSSSAPTSFYHYSYVFLCLHKYLCRVPFLLFVPACENYTKHLNLLKMKVTVKPPGTNHTIQAICQKHGWKVRTGLT